MYISTDAIILKNIPYKETSIISRIFSKETGNVVDLWEGNMSYLRLENALNIALNS